MSTLFVCWMRCVYFKLTTNASNIVILDLICTKYDAKKKNSPQILEPRNKELEEENGRSKTENEILKERALSKSKEILSKQELVDEYKELVDEYKARSKYVEEENQRAKDEHQILHDEVVSLKDKEIRINVENEFLKRRNEECRLERTAERAMFQTMISGLMNGLEDRKRKRNDDEEAK